MCSDRFAADCFKFIAHHAFVHQPDLYKTIKDEVFTHSSDNRKNRIVVETLIYLRKVANDAAVASKRKRSFVDPTADLDINVPTLALACQLPAAAVMFAFQMPQSQERDNLLLKAYAQIGDADLMHGIYTDITVNRFTDQESLSRLSCFDASSNAVGVNESLANLGLYGLLREDGLNDQLAWSVAWRRLGTNRKVLKMPPVITV